MNNKAGQQAIITIMNGIYSEICEIEKVLGLKVDASDFRPRIEYFHDAVRTLTSGNTGSQRLSVEFLAYDIAMLRHIQANPLTRSKGAKVNLSTGTEIMIGNGPELNMGKPGLSIKNQLAELYKNYSVLFVALLSDAANRDYQSRVDECNNEVESIAPLEHAAKATAQKQNASVNIEELADLYIEDPDLMRKVIAAFGNKKNKIAATEAQKKLSEMMKTADKQIKTVEQAHFSFTTGQLAIYENAKDVVKKMAINGMNIVGNFVENAVREATRGGRGR